MTSTAFCLRVSKNGSVEHVDASDSRRSRTNVIYFAKGCDAFVNSCGCLSLEQVDIPEQQPVGATIHTVMDDAPDDTAAFITLASCKPSSHHTATCIPAFRTDDTITRSAAPSQCYREIMSPHEVRPLNSCEMLCHCNEIRRIRCNDKGLT